MGLARTAWQRSDAVLWRRAGDRVLVLGDSGDVHVLVGAGAMLWRVIEVPVPLDELVAEVAAAYEKDAEDVRPGIEGFLTELADAGWVIEVAHR